MQKAILIVAFFCCTLTNSFGQKNPTKIYGTIAINDTASVDATEVTMQEWIYFLVNNNFNDDFFPDPSNISRSARLFFEDLKKKKDFTFIEIVINSGAAKENYGDNGFKLTRKFNDIVNDDHHFFSINIPIVGITYAQAKAFCEWREGVVNKTRAVKVKISLPSIEVYQQIIENRDSVNAKNCYQQNSLNCHCSDPKKGKAYKSQGKCLMRADNYWPSKLGLYNLQGNASEMTSMERIAMGGSFRDYARQSYSDHQQSYSGPKDWLGFRCCITLK